MFRVVNEDHTGGVIQPFNTIKEAQEFIKKYNESFEHPLAPYYNWEHDKLIIEKENENEKTKKD